jgi:hypothetical protein
VIGRLPLAAKGPVSRLLGHDDLAYHVRRTAAGFAATNGRQDIRARYGAAGVEIRSGAARVRLALAGYGYGAALGAVGTVAPRGHANTVVYAHRGLEEFYANGPSGIEQGFLLPAPPAGPHNGPLTLALDLSSNTAVSLERSGQGLVFRAGRPLLAYRGLVVSDASGRQLHAWLQLDAGRLLIRVDDADAHYPLKVDPFIQKAKLTATDGAADDVLGYSVAVSGDTVVAGAYGAKVGSNSEQGAVYVFTKPAGGWANETQAAKLTASDGVANDHLGFSVAVSGDTVVAGRDTNNNAQGEVYVFTKPAGGWANETETAKLTASDGASNGDRFGFSVAVSGDTVVAGAFSFNNIRGSVYLFTKPAGGWANETETAKLAASDGAAFDELGQSVALSADGGTVIASASNATIGTFQTNQGAVYVFTKPAGGWANETEAAKLTASDGASNDNLGQSVAVSSAGDTVVAGTWHASSFQGAAYVFIEPATGWANETQAAKLTPSDGTSNDQLGRSVAVSGDTIFAGAVGANSYQGAVYVFTKPASGWADETEAAKLTASDGAASDSLGQSVAVSGETVVTGAPGAKIGSNAFQGAAYVFANQTQDPTSTSVSCTPGTVAVGQASTCAATVSDTAASPTDPTGTVSSSSSGTGSFSGGGSCTLAATATTGVTRCQVSYTPSAVGAGSHSITASYGGDSAHATSNATTSVTVTKRSTSTGVSCARLKPTVWQCSATVTDTAVGATYTPTGKVSFSSSGRGVFSASQCALSGSGGTVSCSVSYGTPAGASRGQTVSGQYSGDSTHLSSSGSTTLS